MYTGWEWADNFLTLDWVTALSYTVIFGTIKCRMNFGWKCRVSDGYFARVPLNAPSSFQKFRELLKRYLVAPCTEHDFREREREFQSVRKFSISINLMYPTLSVKSADLLLSCPVTNLPLPRWAEKAENLLTPSWQVQPITRLNVPTLELTTVLKSSHNAWNSSHSESRTSNIGR